MGVILRKYGVQADFYFPMIKRDVVDFAVSADWTPATGDTKISKDGGSDANTTNNPAAPASTAGLWKLTLTATEMEAAKISVRIIDSATKAVEDQFLLIETYGHASAEHAFDLDLAEQQVDMVKISGDSTAADNLEAACDGGTYNVGGGAVVAASVTAGVTVTTNNDKTGYTASTVSDKTGYSLAAGHGLATEAKQDSILGYVDCLPATWVVPAAAGDAMALTSGERTTLAAATRDVMLDRVLAGNHDLAGSVGKLLQNCDAPISDVPTVAEFEARTIAAADYFVVGDYTAPPTTAQIKTELEANGSKLDHLWEMTEDDAGVRRLTQNALEQAPSGSGATAEEVWAHADRQLTSDGNIAVADATLTRDLKSITTTVTYCLYTFVMAALKSIVSGTSWLISKPSGVEHKSGTVTTDVNGNITGADLGDES